MMGGGQENLPDDGLVGGSLRWKLIECTVERLLGNKC